MIKLNKSNVVLQILSKRTKEIDKFYPRIDPLSLLKCLSVLLGSTGGIKSKEEVHRLANLMTKFSKKLVSKCIYIQILKTTDTDLLSQFMGAGGWNLVHMWLTDGILAKNWALIQELLELLLLCPVDIERLKSNNCPKLIKGLSKEGSHQGVRILASRLVEQWLKIVKGEAAPNSVPAQIMTGSGTFKACPIPTAIVHPRPSSVISTTQIINSSCSSTSNNNSNSLSEKIETDKNTQFAQSNCCLVVEEEQESKAEDPPNETSFQLISEKALQLSTDVNKPAQCQQQKKSFVVVPGSQASMMVPVYKITIRDGKQVLTKVDTDASNVNINLPGSEVNGDIAAEDIASIENSQEVVSDSQSQLTDKSDNKEEVTVSNSSNSQNVIEETTLDSSKDIAETTDVKIKDKDKQSVSADKSTNDKENRDSSKKDEKKNSTSVITPNSSTTTDKKSSHHSSKSSSKHSSSSSSHRSSNSHRSSSSSLSHRSNSKSTTSKDKTKDKEKHHSSSKHSSNSKSRSDRDKEKEKEKERLKKDQAEKDKATLEKVQGPALTSKLGKIPKKKTEDDKSNDIGSKRSSTDSKESKVKDTKKAVAVSSEKKNISISIENRKSSQDSLTRPKTVKTFNSKFRSTGLEEEAKPPPPRSVKKSNSVIDKQKLLPSKVSSLKRSSPIRESGSSSDKRARLSIENSVATTSEEKKGGSKLIPPKPKPTILQESDMFMDALTAASTKNKEPRKRKRRTSISKESGPETKKLDTSSSSEQNRDTSPPLISPSATSTNTSQKSEDKALVKPNFKFYQDTLETDEDKEEAKGKTKSEGVGSKTKAENGEEEAEDERDEEEDDDEDDDDEEHKKNKNSKDANQEEDEDDEDRSTTPTPAEESFGEKVDSNQDNSESSQNEIRYVEGLRSVLILQKRKGPKKSLKWKVELESIRYFELDETERVNVTKTFSDMKQMEKQNERDAFHMARKLSTEDLMEEKTRWRALIPIDVPPALVEPGKDSREKDIQYAREKGILQALYFHRSMIPDTPAEPEEERLLPVIDAKVIPLDDLTGTKANEKDFTTIPWPDPKPQLPNPQTPPVTMNNFPYQAYPPNNQHPMLPPMGPPQQTPMGPMPPIPQPMMNPMNQMGPDMVSVPPGGGWRTGDGKVVVPDMPGMNPMSNVPGGYPPQGMDGQMVPPPPGMMGPPMYNQPDGFMLPPDDMGYNNVPNNFQGPPGPVMFGPGPGPNFQGGPRGGGPGPMHVNRGRGAPPGAGWFRGGPPVRGVGWRGGWRGNAKQPPVCRQFSKTGYCRAENKCQFLHPGVNCPPF